eukprot:1150687-Pelagomonas_calceolata.AAC.6
MMNVQAAIALAVPQSSNTPKTLTSAPFSCTGTGSCSTNAAMPGWRTWWVQTGKDADNVPPKEIWPCAAAELGGWHRAFT